VAERAAAARLGEFVAATADADLAPGLRHEAKRSLLNFVGAALGAARDPAVTAAVEVLSVDGGRARAGLIGRSERLDVPGAAFVNAVAGNLLDFDDTHLATVIHPSAPVAPPAFALAEETGGSGAAVLAAFVLGAEVECRIGLAVSPGHYARGWHITATAGVFGSAAASAKLLGLDAERTAHALGIAASQAAGVVENLAAGAKNVGVGAAARNGFLAARFAAHGYRAAPRALVGALGWARASGDEPNLGAMVDDLGERWELARNTYKPYPCGIVMHSIVDACLALRGRGLRSDDVESVVVQGDALLLARGDRAVANERDARVSIHHAAAAPLLWGAAGVREFAPERVMDPDAVALRARVRAELDPSLPPGAARVRLVTGSGRTHEETVMEARGSLGSPLPDAELERKLRDLAASGSPAYDPAPIIDSIWRLEEAPDIRDLIRHTTGR
jgi:2-methylcitrate dehydratase PrpD